MSLTEQEIQHIAELAQLEIDPADIDDLTTKLGGIVAFVDQLRETDLSGVVPMAHPLDIESRLRPDKVTELIDRDRYQQNAAITAEGLYRVPKVID